VLAQAGRTGCCHCAHTATCYGADLLPRLTQTLGEVRKPDPAARTVDEALRDGRLQRGMERQTGAVEVLHCVCRASGLHPFSPIAENNFGEGVIEWVEGAPRLISYLIQDWYEHYTDVAWETQQATASLHG